MTSGLVGFKELYLKMQQLAAKAPVATAFGMYDAMQEVMLDAKSRAPVDTGAMRDSGYVTPPTVSSQKEVSIEAGFGGPSEEYVVRQHEDTSLNHPNGGEAKFFENALDAGRGLIMATIAEHVNLYLRSGRTYPVDKRVPTSPWEALVTSHGG